jgi:hypothetical protein
VFAAGQTRPCRHGEGTNRGKNRGNPVRDKVWAWCQEYAASRAVRASDVAAALSLTHDVASRHLRDLAANGDLARQWPGAYALPGAGPFTPPKPVIPDADVIIAFLAADGGGTLGEIQRGTGLPARALNTRLVTLARRGDIIREPDIGGSFWLLPGQEPGEQVKPPDVTDD